MEATKKGFWGVVMVAVSCLALVAGCGTEVDGEDLSDPAPAATGGNAGSGGSGSVCAPGRVVSCSCPDGQEGSQACEPGGGKWGACECGGSAGSGGSSNTGGSAGATGGSAGSTGGSAGSGGSSNTGGSAGSTGGSSNTGGSAGNASEFNYGSDPCGIAGAEKRVLTFELKVDSSSQHATVFGSVVAPDAYTSDESTCQYGKVLSDACSVDEGEFCSLATFFPDCKVVGGSGYAKCSVLAPVGYPVYFQMLKTRTDGKMQYGCTNGNTGPGEHLASGEYLKVNSMYASDLEVPVQTYGGVPDGNNCILQ